MTTALRHKSIRLGQALISVFFVLLCASVLLPVALTVVVSFSTEVSVASRGYTFFPSGWSIAAYKSVFSDNDIFRAYGVTIFVTIVGTSLSVLLTSLCAFAVSSPKVKHRNKLAMFFYLPTIVSGGVVAWYFNIAFVLGLKNNIMVLILPNLVGVWNIFMVRNYYKSLPQSLVESAEIDGARPFKIFFSVIFPLSMPITATITLFISLGYWNDWYLATWFIDNEHRSLFPLQYYLNTLWIKMQDLQSSDIPRETVYVATMFVTMGPIIFIYPFVQKYFIKGIMVGAIKG